MREHSSLPLEKGWLLSGSLHVKLERRSVLSSMHGFCHHALAIWENAGFLCCLGLLQMPQTGFPGVWFCLKVQAGCMAATDAIYQLFDWCDMHLIHFQENVCHVPSHEQPSFPVVALSKAVVPWRSGWLGLQLTVAEELRHCTSVSCARLVSSHRVWDGMDCGVKM